MSKLSLEKGRAHQKLKTRDSILLAAQKLVESGSNFTLEDVAKQAGVSRATIYRYFSNVDLLFAEAALSFKTKSKDELLKAVEKKGLKASLMHIQNYFIELAESHEIAFRKYLSVALDESTKNPSKKTNLRGARRPAVLDDLLNNYNKELSVKNRKKLKQIITVLSGIEPLIANKDVNQLDGKASKELLNWALEMILKGMGKNTK
ncbi:MAG: TetR/AcrR family transcriptional regulator [Chitinophagales bacterium]